MKKEFLVYPETSCQVKACLEFDCHTKSIRSVKLISKVPKGQYNSVLNDAISEAENHVPVFQNDVVQHFFKTNKPEKATLAFLGFYNRA